MSITCTSINSSRSSLLRKSFDAAKLLARSSMSNHASLVSFSAFSRASLYVGICISSFRWEHRFAPRLVDLDQRLEELGSAESLRVVEHHLGHEAVECSVEPFEHQQHAYLVAGVVEDVPVDTGQIPRQPAVVVRVHCC